MRDVDNEASVGTSYEDEEQQYIEEVLPLLKEKCNASFDMGRLPWRWHEKAVVDYWLVHSEQWASKYPSYVHYLHADSPEFRALGDSEQTAAARGFLSAIQWLATNVGHCFLREMLATTGERIEEEPWVRSLHHIEYEVDAAKRTIEKKYDIYKKQRLEKLRDMECKLTSSSSDERDHALKELEADKKQLEKYEGLLQSLTRILEKPKVVDAK